MCCWRVCFCDWIVIIWFVSIGFCFLVWCCCCCNCWYRCIRICFCCCICRNFCCDIKYCCCSSNWGWGGGIEFIWLVILCGWIGVGLVLSKGLGLYWGFFFWWDIFFMFVVFFNLLELRVWVIVICFFCVLM